MVKPTPVTPTATQIGLVGLAGFGSVAAKAQDKESLAANISKYESKGSSGSQKGIHWYGESDYNAYNKGTKGNKIVGADNLPADKQPDFSKITISEYLKRGKLSIDDPKRLFAVGRYQIIPDTMVDLVKALKIDPDKTYLTPATQDYLFVNGLTTKAKGRQVVDDYISGKPGATRNAAILALAKEFASIGVPEDTKKGNKIVKKGHSYYEGEGGNKALNSPEEVGIALDADREIYLNKQKASAIPSTPNTGNQANQASIENQSLKDQAARDKAAGANINNQTTNVQQTNQSTPQPKADDSPPWYKKLFN